MDNFATRRTQALEACEKVINGIEDGTISTSSALLLCKKIARLVNDTDGQEWLSYEYGGYPRTNDGFIITPAWNIAAQHGRSYMDNKDKKRYVFTELAAELEEAIEGIKIALNNYSTQGFSVEGEMALLATERMTLRVSQNTNDLLKSIKTNESRLSILQSQYYDYAVRWQIDLQFGKTAKKVFEEYQENVDLYFSTLSGVTLQKLSAIEDLMEDGNPERYSQVLTSCRRLWECTAKQLHDEVFPNCNEKTYKTKTGKDIDVSGEHYNNKLSAVIETLQGKATKNTLVGSEVVYLIDWMENINSIQSTGVHSEVTREQAMQCIIHTYIALGDILELRDSVQ
ncbi:MAG: hypothetical protein LUF29_06695 [Oscillospiraceae bacterium]|nr:hypothetical protein [Oscillospiraceae bacterium]